MARAVEALSLAAMVPRCRPSEFTCMVYDRDDLRGAPAP